MVFKRLFQGPGKRWQTPAAVPEGQRIYAVGDIHGRLDLLTDLLQQIDEDDRHRPAAATRLIFLGDLVDRGPNSKGVIDRLEQVGIEKPQTAFILGNHDEVFLKAVGGDEKATRFLTRIGGMETILSYGVSQQEYLSYDYPELTKVIVSKVPRRHMEFLASFADHLIVGDYLFVHAGIRPGVGLDRQTPSDLRWIRTEFLESNDGHEHIVVHGHSISDHADVRNNRIGIDTGAFASGRLTALGLEGTQRWFVTAEGEPDLKWGRLRD